MILHTALSSDSQQRAATGSSVLPGASALSTLSIASSEQQQDPPSLAVARPSWPGDATRNLQWPACNNRTRQERSFKRAVGQYLCLYMNLSRKQLRWHPKGKARRPGTRGGSWADPNLTVIVERLWNLCCSVAASQPSSPTCGLQGAQAHLEQHRTRQVLTILCEARTHRKQSGPQPAWSHTALSSLLVRSRGTREAE